MEKNPKIKILKFVYIFTSTNNNFSNSSNYLLRKAIFGKGKKVVNILTLQIN